MAHQTFGLMFAVRNPSVLTNTDGTYVVVVATESASMRYRRRDQLSASERESLWDDFSRAITEQSPATK